MERQSSLRPGNQRRRTWLINGLAAAYLALVVLLLVGILFGPDPRYLLLHKGMTQGQVRLLMGKPDYYDISLDGLGPAWFYCYSGCEIIVDWDAKGRVRQTIMLHYYW